MTNDSTTAFKSESEVSDMNSPRPSTILFVRQFARAYMCIGNSELTRVVAN